MTPSDETNPVFIGTGIYVRDLRKRAPRFEIAVISKDELIVVCSVIGVTVSPDNSATLECPTQNKVT